MKTTQPLDAMGWTAQTQLRRSLESLQWQLSQWFQPGPLRSGSPQWGWLVPILLWTVRVLGLILLAVVVYLLGRQLWQWLTQWAASSQSRQRPEPSEPERSRLDWLAMAQAAQSRQDYPEAFQSLYRALLVQLHDSGMLLQDRARTDREYIRVLDQLWSLNHQPIHLRDDWVTLFKTHELLCFGGMGLNHNQFEQCRTAYDNLALYIKPPLNLDP